jgi:hypothetical protein
MSVDNNKVDEYEYDRSFLTLLCLEKLSYIVKKWGYSLRNVFDLGDC